MRHVLSNAEEVCHIWANPRSADDHGRNGSGNISFCRGLLTSYSTPIAKRFPELKPAGLVLFSLDKYSTTTARQLTAARNAVRGHSTLSVTVPHVDVRELSATERKERYNSSLWCKHAANVNHLRSVMLGRMADCGGSTHGKGTQEKILSAVRKFVAYVIGFRLGDMMAGPSDKQLLRLCKEVFDPQSMQPAVTFPAVSSIDYENQILDGLNDYASADLVNHIVFLFGFSDDNSKLSEADLVERFNDRLNRYHSQENAAEQARENDRRSRLEFEAGLRDERGRTAAEYVNRLSASALLDGWRTGNEHCRYYFSDYNRSNGRMTDTLRKLYRCVREALYHYSENPKPFAQWVLPVTWYAGNYIPFALRLTEAGRLVQTSGNASITAAEFRFWWNRWIVRIHAARSNPAKLAAVVELCRKFCADRKIERSFALENVSTAGLFKIGCHFIPFGELAEIAHSLQLTSTVWKWDELRLTHRPEVSCNWESAPA